MINLIFFPKSLPLSCVPLCHFLFLPPSLPQVFMNSNFVQSTMFGSKDINIATIYGFLIVNRTAYIYIYLNFLFLLG